MGVDVTFTTDFRVIFNTLSGEEVTKKTFNKLKAQHSNEDYWVFDYDLDEGGATIRLGSLDIRNTHLRILPGLFRIINSAQNMGLAVEQSTASFLDDYATGIIRVYTKNNVLVQIIRAINPIENQKGYDQIEVTNTTLHDFVSSRMSDEVFVNFINDSTKDVVLPIHPLFKL